MIRRDYILRMIEQFVQALARLNSLKRAQRWNEAEMSIDEEFHRLLGVGLEEASRLSETELLAHLIQGEPTQAVPEKTLIVATLLREAAETAAANPRRIEESRGLYLKALHLLIDVLAREEVSQYPEFIPSVDSLVLSLQDTELPLRTRAGLMQHYEQIGEFAKAEDQLFAIVDSDPGNRTALEFGLAFYRRLLMKTDDALSAGDLPRPEVQSALGELQQRLTNVTSRHPPFA